MNLKTISLVVSLLAAPVLAPAFTNVNVFPNPVRPSSGHTGVNFTGLSNSTHVEIYDANGNKVLDQVIGSSATTFIWNLKNNAGHNVAGGIYIYVLTDPRDNTVKGKIALIR